MRLSPPRLAPRRDLARSPAAGSPAFDGFASRHGEDAGRLPAKIMPESIHMMTADLRTLAEASSSRRRTRGTDDQHANDHRQAFVANQHAVHQQARAGYCRAGAGRGSGLDRRAQSRYLDLGLRLRQRCPNVVQRGFQPAGARFTRALCPALPRSPPGCGKSGRTRKGQALAGENSESGERSGKPHCRTCRSRAIGRSRSAAKTSSG